MNKFTFSLICLLAILVGFGCQKFENVEFENSGAEYAIPLVSSRTTLRQIMDGLENNSYLTIDPDGLITLNFSGNIGGRTSSEIFSTITQLNGVPIPIEDTLSAIPFEFPDNLDIDYAILKSGQLRWAYKSNHEEDVTVVITIPSATKDGQPFRRVRHHNYTGSTIEEVTIFPFDLTGYTLEPVRDTFFINYYAYREDSEIRDTLSEFFLFLQEMEGSYVQGYLGNEIYEFERERVEIDFFQNWASGEIYFEEPEIQVTVSNSFGFPVRTVTNIANVITVLADTLALESEFVQAGNGIYFNYPSLDEVGETVETYFTFNKDNSNIADILGAGPIAFDYDIDALANPDMDTTIRGFLTDSSFFRFQLAVELPFYGKAKGFEAFDTVSIDFSEYESFEYSEFKVIAENEMALDIGMQFFFNKADGTVIDSLFQDTNTLIEGTDVDAEGNALGINEKTTFVKLEGARFDRIKEAKQIAVRASFSTIDNGETSVKVLADQAVSIRMGMKVGIE